MTATDPIDMRQRILDEAARLFVSSGYHGISMREIAEAVGVSKAGLYYHFRDKEELFLAMLMACLDRLDHGLTQASARDQSARSEIEAILRAIFAQPPEQRAIMRLASSELGHLTPKARAAFGERYYTQFIGRVEQALRGGVERGELRPLDTHTATWVLLGMAYPFFAPNETRDLGALEPTIALILTIFFEGAAALPSPHA
jgi:AcrR family transcriptional regulator